MNKEERIKLVFETISKIVGFEIKPDKEFYIVGNGEKDTYLIDKDLNLLYKKPDGSFLHSGYSILPIFRGGYQLEEIQEPLLTDEEKEFLRNFNFEELEKISNRLNMYDKNGLFVNAINLNITNLSFDGLKEGKKYSRKKLGL